MKTKTIDFDTLIKLIPTGIVDYRPLIALCMHACGCSYAEIGMLFGISRQMAHKLVKNALRDIEL